VLSIIKIGAKVEKIDPAIRLLSTRAGLYKFYQDQLKKFYKIGLGNQTEFNVIVTQTLIDATIRRANQLGGIR
jgi:hypothetical protein